MQFGRRRMLAERRHRLKLGSRSRHSQDKYSANPSAARLDEVMRVTVHTLKLRMTECIPYENSLYATLILYRISHIYVLRVLGCLARCGASASRCSALYSTAAWTNIRRHVNQLTSPRCGGIIITDSTRRYTIFRKSAKEGGASEISSF